MRRTVLQRHMLLVAASTSLLLAGASDLEAQGPERGTMPPSPGTRIRVQAFGKQHVGAVQEMRGDTVVLRGQDAHGTSFARHDIERAWVSRGRRTPRQGAWRGMGLGLLVGGLSGIVIGAASGDDEPGLLAMSAEEKALAGGIVLGGAGVLVGGIAGAMRPGERWTRVDRRTLAVRPGVRGGVTLSVSQAF